MFILHSCYLMLHEFGSFYLLYGSEITPIKEERSEEDAQCFKTTRFGQFQLIVFSRQSCDRKPLILL